MNVMSELMAFSQEKKMRPDQALEAWVEQFDAQGGGGSQQLPGGNPQIQLPPNGNRTPSMGNMALSQQGTNSSGPSANTSPQVNNKRRRSTVKDEDGGGGPDGLLNQQRVKPSPRMTKKAKP